MHACVGEYFTLFALYSRFNTLNAVVDDGRRTHKHSLTDTLECAHTQSRSRSVSVSVSIGLSLFRQAKGERNAIYQRKNCALYISKHSAHKQLLLCCDSRQALMSIFQMFSFFAIHPFAQSFRLQFSLFTNFAHEYYRAAHF